MVSDFFTAIIIGLLTILVVYPASRALLQGWQTWYRRQLHLRQKVPVRQKTPVQRR
jgi:hypothetical protein